MFSMILTENNLERFTPDFTARKSVFCFGNRMVFLGSGISNSNAARQTETTLFQHSFTGVGTAISVNGKKRAAFFDSELPDKGLRHLEDGFGNHYFIPQGGGAVRTGISHQVSAEEKTRARTEGDFAWAVIPHGTAPKDASYEYWILLAPDSGQVRASVSRRPYEVLQQDTRHTNGSDAG